VSMVLSSGTLYGVDGPPVAQPLDVAGLVLDFLGETLWDQEAFLVLALTAKNVVREVRAAHLGDQTCSMVSPATVFRNALLMNAAAVVVAHNHPSGDPEPSPEDVAVTERLVSLGKELGVPVLDHVIVAPGGRWVSLKASRRVAFD
jgi:DNA repair protein RadC